MRGESLNARARRLNEPVKVTVVLSTFAARRLYAHAMQLGVSGDDAVGEAVREWCGRRDGRLDRRRRLDFERQMREAPQDFVRYLRNPAGHPSAASYMLPSMPIPALTLKARRVATGTSQERLAQLAGCSLSTVRMYENGLIPSKGSPALARITETLNTLEGEAA